MKYPSVKRTVLLIGVGIIIYIQLTAPVLVAAKQLSIAAKTTANDTNMVPFYWIVVIVGGCIAVTLTYVSWRKYNGEKKKQKQADKDSDS